MAKNKKKPPHNAPVHQPENDEAAIAEIDRILTRLDTEIPKAKQEMAELLARLRTTRIAA